jgi:hypothetical protein
VSTLKHLDEMDRLLRDVQEELAPDRESAAAAPSPSALTPAAASPSTTTPAAPSPSGTTPASQPPIPANAPDSGPPAPPDPDRRLQVLTELAGRLLASIRELLAATSAR